MARFSDGLSLEALTPCPAIQAAHVHNDAIRLTVALLASTGFSVETI
jgi:hypothetical protein